MSANSRIEWTEATWNPVTGCTRVSTGCDHCYAVRMTHRLRDHHRYSELTVLNGAGNRHFNGVVRTHDDLLGVPFLRKKPTTWFVCSMSDLFHDSVSEHFIAQVFDAMRWCPWHTFQVLTKRPKRMSDWVDRHIRKVPPNVWLGVSVEDNGARDRIIDLVKIDAAVRFLSCEPLLAPLENLTYLSELHWVIVGAESGPGARPMKSEWAESIVEQCRDTNVPCFVKQLCENGRKIPFCEWPKHLQVREYPRGHKTQTPT